MKLPLVGSVAIAVLFIGCSQPPRDYADHKLIYGLASPVSLSGDSTIINLEDYVLALDSIDSVTVSDPLSVSIDGKFATVTGNPDTHLNDLLIWSNAQAYCISLQKSSKQTVTLTYSGKAGEVKSKGEFNGWNGNQTVFQKDGSNFTTTLTLSPGRYQYLLIVDGKEIRDPNNKDSIENGMGGWNSVLSLPKPDREKLPLLTTDKAQGDQIELTLSNPATEVKVYWQNFLLDVEQVNTGTIKVSIPAAAANTTRSFIRAWTANSEGISNDVLIPLHRGTVLQTPDSLLRSDKEAQVLYFMMIDRFNNGNARNDEPVDDKSIHPKANYYGGDLAGITQKISEGYFHNLGVNTLWLSPITQNPKGAYGKYLTPPTTFSAYHGYWPVSLQQIDYRFGNSAELNELLTVAHQHNINVILDYVAHHVHEQHPLYKQKPEWFTSLYLPDGSLNTERWDDQRLTTWFDTFLPTLDLRRPEVVEAMTDTAMYWLQHYAIDGFRHDASKHIDLLFWRELTKKIKQHALKHNQSIYQIGETYGGRELVNSYVNSGMLDAQFDFNVYDDAVVTFAKPEVPFSRLLHSVDESMNYFGDHHTMGNVTGNQDRARFISYADGSIRFDEDSKKAGWTRTIRVQDTSAYKKLQLLTAFMMSIPGVPVVYYGDEIGDPGGNDPDNRRMMRFENLSTHEASTQVIARKLVTLRRNNLALLYGDWQVMAQTEQQCIIRRKYFSSEAVIVFNKATTPATLSLGSITPRLKTNFDGVLNTSASSSSIHLKPLSFEILTTD